MYQKAIIQTILAAILLASLTHSRTFPPPPLPPPPTKPNPYSTRGKITATGIGRRSVKTSIATISLAVEERGRTAVGTQEAVALTTARLFRYLRRENVKKLETTGVSLSAEYDFKVKPPRITGYIGRNTVSFEVPNEKAGAVLDGAVRYGATRINSIRFRATPEKAAAARKNAIRDAVRNAKGEANTAVRATGYWLGKPVSIKVTDSFAQTTRTSGARRPTTPIAGGEQTITASVTIEYAIW